MSGVLSPFNLVFLQASVWDALLGCVDRLPLPDLPFAVTAYYSPSSFSAGPTDPLIKYAVYFSCSVYRLLGRLCFGRRSTNGYAAWALQVVTAGADTAWEPWRTVQELPQDH